MAFPLTGSSLTANGVTVAVLNEGSAPVFRTAGTATTIVRTASATRADYLADVWTSAPVTHVSNPPTSNFPRSTAGVSTAILNPWISRNVTRVAAAATTASRSCNGVTRFLPLATRRPNDTAGRVRAGTAVTGQLRLSVLRLSPNVIAGSTTVTGSQIGFQVGLAGTISSSTVATGSMNMSPKNDNFVDRIRIWTGVPVTSNNSAASLEYVFPNADVSIGGSQSLWYSWCSALEESRGTVVFQVSSTAFKPDFRVLQGAYAWPFDNDQTTGWQTGTYYYDGPPYVGHTTYADGVWYSTIMWQIFDENNWLYFRVATASDSEVAGGDFTLNYSPGRSPTGTYTPVPQVLVATTVHGSTGIHSVRPYRTGDGYVVMADLPPGEIGDGDLPAGIVGSTGVSADMTVDSPRIIAFDGNTALSLPKVAANGATVSSAVGTGVKNRSTPRSTSPAVSGDEQLSTLTPYYV